MGVPRGLGRSGLRSEREMEGSKTASLEEGSKIDLAFFIGVVEAPPERLVGRDMKWREITCESLNTPLCFRFLFFFFCVVFEAEQNSDRVFR